MARRRCFAARSVINCRFSWIRTSIPTNRVSTCCAFAVSNARGISSLLLMSRRTASMSSTFAAFLVASHCGGTTGFPMLLSKPTVALARQLGHEGAEARHIAARPRQAGDNADAEWLSNRGHHDRNRFRSILRGLGGRRAARHDQIDMKPDQFAGQDRKPLSMAVGRPVFQNII